MKQAKYALLTLAILTGSIISHAQTADEIVQKHIAAIGGEDNWKKVNSMKISASAGGGGVEYPITVTTINGKCSRTEFAINGMTCYMIYTKNEGWSYFPIQGQTKPEALTEDQLKQSQDQLDLQGPLIDYKKKGNKIEYLGKDDVEGTDCYKLKVTYASGKEETKYFDASTYYELRTDMKIKANGKEMESKITYGNYQKLPEGIVVPMSMDQGMGTMTIKSVEVNKPVDESIFKPTASAATDTKK